MADQAPDPELERTLAAAGFERRADGSWRPGRYLRRLRWHVVLLALVRDARTAVRWVQELFVLDPDPVRYRERVPLLAWDRATQWILAPGARPPSWSRTFGDHERTITGTAYGRPFTATFPPATVQPVDHRWAVLTWSGSSSGTGRPETMAACVTCSEGHDQVVNPYACVIESDELWANYYRDDDPEYFRRHYLGTWPQPPDEWPPVPESEYDGPDDFTPAPEKCSNPECPSTSGHSGPCPPADREPCRFPVCADDREPCTRVAECYDQENRS